MGPTVVMVRQARSADAEKVAMRFALRKEWPGACRSKRRPFRKGGRKEAGYTLLEICLTMVVVAVMIGATMPITQGVISEERLRGLGNDLADLATTARKLAVLEGRTYVVRFGEDRVSLGPWGGESAEMEEQLALKLPRDAGVAVRHDETEKWRSEMVWFFQPGGLSDPLQMRLHEGASWSVRVFSPLTALSREEASHFQ